VGGIARAHGEDFKRQHALTAAQRNVLRAVSACSAAGHLLIAGPRRRRLLELRAAAMPVSAVED